MQFILIIFLLNRDIQNIIISHTINRKKFKEIFTCFSFSYFIFGTSKYVILTTWGNGHSAHLSAQGPQVAGGCRTGQGSGAPGKKGQRKWGRGTCGQIPFSVKKLERVAEAAPGWLQAVGAM